jgi:hypothetical protein
MNRPLTSFDDYDIDDILDYCNSKSEFGTSEIWNLSTVTPQTLKSIFR